MEFSKLKFVVNETGIVSEEEKNILQEAYKNLFIEIYGYDILTEYLKQKNTLKKPCLFKETFVDSIDVLKSVNSCDNISLLKVYDENNKLVGFARFKVIEKRPSKNPIIEIVDKLLEKHLDFTNEKSVSIPDVAVISEYSKFSYDIWKSVVAFAEMYFKKLGFERLYVEIPLNSPLLLRADDLGFVESPEDVPVTEKPRTRILNKYLERYKNAEFSSSRK